RAPDSRQWLAEHAQTSRRSRRPVPIGFRLGGGHPRAVCHQHYGKCLADARTFRYAQVQAPSFEAPAEKQISKECRAPINELGCRECSIPIDIPAPNLKTKRLSDRTWYCFPANWYRQSVVGRSSAYSYSGESKSFGQQPSSNPLGRCRQFCPSRLSRDRS